MLSIRHLKTCRSEKRSTSMLIGKPPTMAPMAVAEKRAERWSGENWLTVTVWLASEWCKKWSEFISHWICWDSGNDADILCPSHCDRIPLDPCKLWWSWEVWSWRKSASSRLWTATGSDDVHGILRASSLEAMISAVETPIVLDAASPFDGFFGWMYQYFESCLDQKFV